MIDTVIYSEDKGIFRKFDTGYIWIELNDDVITLSYDKPTWISYETYVKTILTTADITVVKNRAGNEVTLHIAHHLLRRNTSLKGTYINREEMVEILL